MKTYQIQFRQEHGGRLRGIGAFRARPSGGAILQAAKMLCRGGDVFVEIVATEQE